MNSKMTAEYKARKQEVLKEKESWLVNVMHREVMRTITESIGDQYRDNTQGDYTSPIQIRRNRVFLLVYIREEDNQTYNGMKKEARKLAKEMARIERNNVVGTYLDWLEDQSHRQLDHRCIRPNRGADRRQGGP